MLLSKTNFIQSLNCLKSLWLLKHKPDIYPHGVFSNYEKKIALEGYEVEQYAKELLNAATDVKLYSFHKPYKTSGGLYAEADIVRENEDGTINLYEVKSSTSVKRSNPHSHLKDAAFQTITAEKTGKVVREIFIVHLNKDYLRGSDIDVSQMLIFSNETENVRDIISETEQEINEAINLLTQSAIDETSCSCLSLNKTHHCDSFNYFNSHIPKSSIYNLPRIHKNKLEKFSNEGRFDLNLINEKEVTANQATILRAAHTNSPIMDRAILLDFYNAIQYPLYFLDYETYSSAVPIISGAKPHAPIPFQFSLHIKMNEHDKDPKHVEYLADNAELPLEMIKHLETAIDPSGSVVTWHKSFENNRNSDMADWYPTKANFLNDIIDRTIDLEDIFKGGYVDIGFEGSTSIKKVLPVLVPSLSYAGMGIGSGTDAMDGWVKMLELKNGPERLKLRNEMLAYCKLDTLAMVRIFETIKTIGNL